MNGLYSGIPDDVKKMALAAAIVKSNEIRDRNQEDALTQDQETKMEVLYFPSYKDMTDAWAQAPDEATKVSQTKAVYGFCGIDVTDGRMCYGIVPGEVDPKKINWATLKVDQKKDAKVGQSVIILSTTPAGMVIDSDGGVWLREQASERVTIKNIEADQWATVAETRAAKQWYAATTSNAEVAVQTQLNKVTVVKADALVDIAKKLIDLKLTPESAIAEAHNFLRA